ncbi:MAG: TRAP transporter small permease subunit [Acidiferrobacterales bacterium]
MSNLAVVVRIIDSINDLVGRATAWLALILVLDQFIVVVLRYVFSIGFIYMQESIWYLYGIMFMVGAGFTLLQDGHVRVDILYRGAKPKTKALVDLLGVVFFLIPVCVLIMWISWSYVINSWKVFEGSIETGGLPLVFLLKTVIWIFVVLIFLQGISLALRSIMTLAGADAPVTEEQPDGV